MGRVIFPTFDDGPGAKRMISDSPSVPAVGLHRAGVAVNMPQPIQGLSQAHSSVSIRSLGLSVTAGSERN